MQHSDLSYCPRYEKYLLYLYVNILLCLTFYDGNFFIFIFLFFILLIFSGLIISGGLPTDIVGSSVEVFVPSTGQHCQLPDMTGEPRYFHSMEETTVCGGELENTRKSCLALTDKTWQTRATLVEKRSSYS